MSKDEQVDLRHHGDREVGPGLLDLAVNVRPTPPPGWLRDALRDSLDQLSGYPDDRAATRAVAARHGRLPEEVLLTNGAAEAFVLLARVLQPRHAVCVHPSFTEPEVALRAAGHAINRLVLPAPFVLRAVPDEADLVVLGNPTNPTGVLHHDLARLCRPGRTVVVDEAFMDAVPGETGSLATRSDLPGLVVVRSLTKTWSLAGLRVGYLLAAPELVARLRDAQPLWSVSTPALVAAELCSAPPAVEEAAVQAQVLARERDQLSAALSELGVEVSSGSAAPFLLCATPGPLDVRVALRARGIAVRRGDTFPGLGRQFWRTAVRDADASHRLTKALRTLLCTG